MYQTTNRKLEQFLFYHDIFFVETYRAEDGMTVWVYDDNDYLQHVICEWKEVIRRRQSVNEKKTYRKVNRHDYNEYN